MTPVNMFTAARLGLPLTPSQRTLLKMVKTVVFALLAFILSGQGLSVLQAVQQPGADVGTILQQHLLVPCLMVVLLTTEKYFTAQGDPTTVEAAPLADGLVPPPPPAPAAPVTSDAAAS